MHSHFPHRLCAVIFGCAAPFLTLVAAHAQALPSTAHPPVRTSRVEVYGAYSYLHPLDVDATVFNVQPKTLGALGGANFYFNRFLGVQAEGTISPTSGNDCVSTVQGGPVLRYPIRRVVPFVHATAGGAKLGGSSIQPCSWGWGVTGGLGFDYVLPGFRDRLAIRPVQADYEYSQADFGPVTIPGGSVNGTMILNAYRLSSGLVLRFGNMTPPVALGMSCSVTPGDVYAGEPVTGAAQFLYMDLRKKTSYTWSTSGGTISGKGDTVQIDTTGLKPGNYILTGRAVQGKLPEQQAECNAHFAIKQIVLAPPAISCAATPASVHPGDSVTITSKAVSPSNRALTYSYTSTAGLVSGNGATATLNTSGTPATSITVTCNVVDDLGKTASATTAVQILPVILPPAPSTQALCTIGFDRDRNHPERVDNEAKGCLDDIALTLQRQSDAKLVVVGSRDDAESPDISIMRVVDTKFYLTREKGIDPARIQLRSGNISGRRVFNTLVPTGATFTADGSSVVDEGTVKPMVPSYTVKTRKHVRRKRK